MENDFKSEKINLIIGIGNPDDKYVGTYHNVGLDFIKLLNEELTPPHTKKIYESNCFMNVSGLFVKEKVLNHNITTEQLLVVQDDSDIQMGNYKISFGRGPAGHKGIQSIINHLGTKDFWRLRIGIGKENDRVKAKSFVLKKINKEDKEKIQKVFQEVLPIISK